MAALDNLFALTVTTFISFLAIMNPIANTAIFVGLTEDLEPSARRAVAYRSVLTAFVVVTAFTVLGKGIFAVFDISLPAFRLTGGILVFVIGFQMLHGEPSRVLTPSASDTDKGFDAQVGIAIAPLAIPILAGPGAIATAINFTAAGGIEHILVTLVSFGILCLVTALLFLGGRRILGYLGVHAIKVITRLMGLILAVIGMQMFLVGAQGAAAMLR